MIDTILTLITAQRAQGADGVWRDGGETRRDVFARMGSVGSGEFFAAGEIGLRPDLCFVLNACEYAGEDECEHDGTRYAVYRTYREPGADDIELYVQRKAGVYG